MFLKSKTNDYLRNEIIDLELRNRIDAFCSESEISKNTKKAYDSGIKYFWTWALLVYGLEEHYPVSGDVLVDYVLSHVYGLPPDIDKKMVKTGAKSHIGRHKISSIRLKVRALSHAHKQNGFYENACDSKIISMLLRDGQRRQTKEGIVKKQSLAITVDILKRMIRKINTRTIDGLRDRAILEFGFYTGGRRRSEIANAEYRFLTKRRGGFEYYLHTSKTDQAGRGAIKLLRSKNANALKSWICAADLKDGYLFRKIKNGNVMQDRITGAEINTNIIKRYISTIREDDSKYTAHGLRRGFITQCGRDGIPLWDVLVLTGHKDVRQAMEYYEEGRIWANSATKI